MYRYGEWMAKAHSQITGITILHDFGEISARRKGNTMALNLSNEIVTRLRMETTVDMSCSRYVSLHVMLPNVSFKSHCRCVSPDNVSLIATGVANNAMSRSEAAMFVIRMLVVVHIVRVFETIAMTRELPTNDTSRRME